VRDERHAPQRSEPAQGEPRDLDVVRLFSELKPRDRALLWLPYVEGDTHADLSARSLLERLGK